MPKHGKIVVGFDESDRKEFVSGFRKRKQQRRQKAQADLKLKARRDKLQERKDKKQQLLDLLEEQDKIDGIVRREESAGPSSKRGAKKLKSEKDVAAQSSNAKQYEDEFTKKTFGTGTVVVETSASVFRDHTEDGAAATAPSEESSDSSDDDDEPSDGEPDAAVESLAVGQSALVAELAAEEEQEEERQDKVRRAKAGRKRPRPKAGSQSSAPRDSKAPPNGSQAAPSEPFDPDMADLQPRAAVSFLSRGEKELEELAYGGGGGASGGRAGGRGRGSGRGGGRGRSGGKGAGRGRSRGQGRDGDSARGGKRRRVTTGIGKFIV